MRFVFFLSLLHLVNGIPFFDIETVCTPDFQQCRHGGYVFRDRNHDCEFTPCTLISSSVYTSPISLKDRNHSMWLRSTEFVVPMMKMTDMILGKRVENHLIQQYRRKTKHLQTIWRHQFVEGLDFYLTDSTCRMDNATASHIELVRATVDPTSPIYSVMHAPWSRRSLLGQAHRYPTIAVLNTSLHAVKKVLPSESLSSWDNLTTIVSSNCLSRDVKRQFNMSFVQSRMLFECEQLLVKKSRVMYVNWTTSNQSIQVLDSPNTTTQNQHRIELHSRSVPLSIVVYMSRIDAFLMKIDEELHVWNFTMISCTSLPIFTLIVGRIPHYLSTSNQSTNVGGVTLFMTHSLRRNSTSTSSNNASIWSENAQHIEDYNEQYHCSCWRVQSPSSTTTENWIHILINK